MDVVEVNDYPIGPGANLVDANLSGADLYRANLAEANLSGANLKTIWPMGFDPVAAGVIFAN